MGFYNRFLDKIAKYKPINKELRKKQYEVDYNNKIKELMLESEKDSIEFENKQCPLKNDKCNGIATNCSFCRRPIVRITSLNNYILDRENNWNSWFYVLRPSCKLIK